MYDSKISNHDKLVKEVDIKLVKAFIQFIYSN
jgi:hypothetical protein